MNSNNTSTRYRSNGKVELTAWRQGGPLVSRKVEVSKLRSTREGNEYFWTESGETERLPVEPRRCSAYDFPIGKEQFGHFFYEADRGTMNTTDMLKKLRAHFHFI